MTRLSRTLILVTPVGALLSACSSSTTSPTTTTTGTTTGSNATNTALPAPFRLFSDSVTITIEGTNLVLRTKNVPDHKSAYFQTTDSRYQAYNGTNLAFIGTVMPFGALIGGVFVG